jgi:hypothetical protein
MRKRRNKRKKRQSEQQDAEPMTWDDIIGRLLIHGLSAEQIGNMTYRQAMAALDAIESEIRLNARLWGCEFEDEKEEQVQEVTPDNAAMIASSINQYIRGGR